MAETNDQMLVQIAALTAQIEELQARLEESQDALRAISAGQVDALVVDGDDSVRIYTLQGADYAYRVMVESIHEGAVNIQADGLILYCNRRLADLLNLPLEQVLGTSFYTYLPPAERESFVTLVQKGLENFARAEFNLLSPAAIGGQFTPVLITASAAQVNDRRGVCLVVTDLTEQRQARARERELQLRLMDQREDERVTIARNLHDGPLQDVIGLSYSVQALAPPNIEGEDLTVIRERLIKLAGDLRSVCNELRPPNTIRFGLAKAIQYQTDEVRAKHPGLIFHQELTQDGDRLSAEVRTTLFRIYQECLNNIVRHANATEVTVRFLYDQDTVRLEVRDNGSGFQPPEDWVELARQGHFGLIGMRERSEAIGGKLQVCPGNNGGTTIQVDVPVNGK